MVGNDIPEGQGSVNELLAECFELQYELKVAPEADADVPREVGTETEPSTEEEK